MSQHSDDALAAAWHDLMGRYHHIACALDRELSARHGMTGSEFEVLQQLAAAEGNEVRMHELGERVHLTQSALSRMIGRLERDGLAERGMCTEDRRSVWARITTAGVDRYAAAKPTQRAVLREQDVEAAVS